jgi:HlyD family secretion protein
VPKAAETGGGKSRLPFIIAGVVVVVVVALLWWLLRPKDRTPDERFTGYVVSDNVNMASPIAGTLSSVAVKRGQRVAAGDPLFSIDATVRGAQAEQARAQISAGLAQVAQQRAAIERARADLASSEAEARRAGAEVRRLQAAQREKAGAVAQLDLEKAEATYRGASSQRDAARAQVASAQGALAAAQAQVDEARAGLTSAQRQVSDLAPVAPRAGRIDDIMYKAGESVGADAPIVTIVPDDEIKVRFYVPQSQVNGFKPGRRVAIACDGCATGMTAVVDFVASRPEYTPPIIYSLDARQKLVFMVEAQPSDPRALVPGQPMDVAGTASALKTR